MISTVLADRLDIVVAGGDPDLAAQQELGLWAQRRA